MFDERSNYVQPFPSSQSTQYILPIIVAIADVICLSKNGESRINLVKLEKYCETGDTWPVIGELW